jgi:hypothetical protein
MGRFAEMGTPLERPYGRDRSSYLTKVMTCIKPDSSMTRMRTRFCEALEQYAEMGTHAEI